MKVRELFTELGEMLSIEEGIIGNIINNTKQEYFFHFPFMTILSIGIPKNQVSPRYYFIRSIHSFIHPTNISESSHVVCTGIYGE